MVRLTEDMKRVVEEQRLGFVATVCPDGTPNVSPKGWVRVWDDERLLIVDVRSPGTIANLHHQPVAEINIVDPLARTGYRFKGPCVVYTDGETFDRIVAFVHESRPQLVIQSGVLMQVERAVPLISPAYDRGDTEDMIRERWMTHFATLEARWRKAHPGD